MNLYLEADESGHGKDGNAALLGTPGLELLFTLPTSPVRGIWTGLIDNLPGSTGTDLSAVVAGSKLYFVYEPGTVSTNGTAVTWLSGQQFSTTSPNGAIAAGATMVIAGTAYTVQSVTDATHLTLTSSAGTHASIAFDAYAQIGDVGNDSTSSPVQFEVNGGQLLVSSAGNLWLWNGSLQQVFFNDGTGTVDTSGTAVTLLTGSTFDASQVGSYILIAGTPYLIDAFVDENHITLSTSAGVQTGATFYVLTGPSSTPIYVAAAQIAFLDTYFIALPAGSKLYYISAINDGLNWNPLDFGTKSAYPDNIAALLVDHEELYLFGSEASEVWQDTGGSTLSTFPFERNPGGFISQGNRAPFATASVNNGLVWIGGTPQGNPIAWFGQGFQPQRISTHAIEAAWGDYATITDAIAFVYVEDGHQFWVISFPTANATWAWDATSGVWHERGWWNGASIDRHRVATHGYVFGFHLAGDWQSGKLYQMSNSLYDDAGTAIHRIRTAPYLTSEEDWTFYSRFRLAMQSGPNPTLAWSDDLGENYSAPLAGSPIEISPGVNQMSQWTRLGRARARIFSVEADDAVEIAFTGAYIDARTGNG